MSLLKQSLLFAIAASIGIGTASAGETRAKNAQSRAAKPAQAVAPAKVAASSKKAKPKSDEAAVSFVEEDIKLAEDVKDDGPIDRTASAQPFGAGGMVGGGGFGGGGMGGGGFGGGGMGGGAMAGPVANNGIVDGYYNGPLFSPGILGQQGAFFGGADYLLAKARFSDNTAYFTRDVTSNTNVNPEVSTVTDRAHPFNWSHQSGLRAFFGYRLLRCGGDITFTYWNLHNNAGVQAGPSNIAAGNNIIAGHLENNPPNGGFLFANSSVNANLYDVAFSKCLSFGGGDCCDPCACPLWDVRWSAGLRFADIRRDNDNRATDANGALFRTGTIDQRFRGTGPLVGMQLRRYFGKQHRLSAYARATGALIVGEYDLNRQTIAPGVVNGIPTVVTRQFEHFERIIPVVDIELGGSFQLTPSTFLSAGYFVQSFWDLGQTEHIDGTNFTPNDNSNIFGFDGLFVRAEVLF